MRIWLYIKMIAPPVYFATMNVPFSATGIVREWLTAYIRSEGGTLFPKGVQAQEKTIVSPFPRYMSLGEPYFALPFTTG